MDYKYKLKFKSDFLKFAREFLLRKDFTEINTPKISFMPTDQDDHLFRVDYFGTETYLIQSPQFYKQAHVINGLASIFEVAPVFRAEPRVTKRHLSEFTSLDIESSTFNSVAEIINFEADLILYLSDKLSSRYDIRPISTFDVVDYNEAKKKLGLSESQPLTAKHEKEIGEHFDSDGVFIVNYPACERVFYYSDRDGVSQSFDLIVGGLELTSGGIRTSSREKLVQKMEESGVDTRRYTPYLDLFDENTPVHGGFAIGLERILSKYLGLQDIAEANPYSKKPDAKGETLKWRKSVARVPAKPKITYAKCNP